MGPSALRQAQGPHTQGPQAKETFDKKKALKKISAFL